MRYMEIKISFAGGNHDDRIVDLISDIFYTLGAKGVVVDDPHLIPVEGWGADAVPLPDKPAVTGYLPVDERTAERSRFLSDSLDALARANDFSYDLAAHPIAEEDWAESWKAFFYPVKITEHMVVKPTWRAYDARPDERVIEIDPGMAFGTGTHPTTALCLQLLEAHLRPGDHVIDVGTGSGILLIAAAKLGAGAITGVDTDPIAIKVAHANLQLNGLTLAEYDLHCGHLVDAATGPYDIVVANILADVVIELLDHIPRMLKPGGLFICSGIIDSRRSAVADKMTACGLTALEILDRQEWSALAGRLGAEQGGRS